MLALKLLFAGSIHAIDIKEWIGHKLYTLHYKRITSAVPNEEEKKNYCFMVFINGSLGPSLISKYFMFVCDKTSHGQLILHYIYLWSTHWKFVIVFGNI